MPRETEIKISVGDLREVRARIRAAGFTVHRARVFEQNIVLDDAKRSIKKRGLLLRVRSAGKLVTCTFKGPETGGVHKSRDEREFHADNLDACVAFFEGLGFTPTFRYEKHRTEFTRKAAPGIVTIDETPVGVFLELEGDARWIDRTAKELGYSRADYITLSYSKLYEKWAAEFQLPSDGASPPSTITSGSSTIKPLSRETVTE